MNALEELSETVLSGPDGSLTVRLHGNVTIRNAAAVCALTVSAWEEMATPAAVILDLSEVRHLDSSGVGALMELARHALQSGLSLRLCHLQDSPRRLLARTGLDRLFEIYATVEDALHSTHIQGETQQ